MYSEGRNHDQARVYRPDLRRSIQKTWAKSLGIYENELFQCTLLEIMAAFSKKIQFLVFKMIISQKIFEKISKTKFIRFLDIVSHDFQKIPVKEEEIIKTKMSCVVEESEPDIKPWIPELFGLRQVEFREKRALVLLN